MLSYVPKFEKDTVHTIIVVILLKHLFVIVKVMMVASVSVARCVVSMTVSSTGVGYIADKVR